MYYTFDNHAYSFSFMTPCVFDPCIFFHIDDNLCIPCLVDIFLFLINANTFKLCTHIYVSTVNPVSSLSTLIYQNVVTLQ